MRDIKNKDLQPNEFNYFMHFLSIISKPIEKNFVKDKIQLLEKSIPMHKSRKFKHINARILLHRKEAW